MIDMSRIGDTMYRDGYRDGYEDGREDGYKEGYDLGLDDGYDRGYAEGYDGAGGGYDVAGEVVPIPGGDHEGN